MRFSRVTTLLLVLKLSASVIAFTPGPISRSSLRWTVEHRAVGAGDINIDEVEDVEITPEEMEANAKTKALCAERNICFDSIKNARDLASPPSSPVKLNRLYRTGRVSDASGKDLKTLFQEFDVKTIVDLRSPTELKEDPTLQREEVFGEFANLVWTERGRNRDGCLTELEGDASPIPKKRDRFFPSSSSFLDDDDDEDEDCDVCEGGVPASEALKVPSRRKERHYVSLMNEFKYVRGTISKVRKRDVARTILKSPGALVSQRVRDSVKSPFLEKINDGGLPMLNELLLRFGSPGINYVLELCADRSRHPLIFHCTAGKDRTGMITAIILSFLGVPDEEIVEDYSLSANVYAEMNDHKAMVGALSQRSLNPKTFLGAPPQVMFDTLDAIREEYGSVEGYMDWIGFGPEKQAKLRKALTEE